MSGLLTHALEQEVCLPVARPLVSVRTAPQPFELPTGRGLKHGRKRLEEWFSGSLGQGPRLPPEDLLGHLLDGLFCSHEREPFSLCLLLVGGRRNIIVTPARTFVMSGLIALALLCPLCGIVEPGVGESVRQTALALPDVEDEAPEVGAAPPTGGRGARSAKGHLLAAVALEGDCGRMPLVDLAEGHLVALVAGLDALEDLRHGLLPLPSAVRSARRWCRAALWWGGKLTRV